MTAPRSGSRLRTAKPYTFVEGDCLPALAAMPDRAFDVVLTDPPYSEHVHTHGRRASAARHVRTAELGFEHLTAEAMDAAAAAFGRLCRRWCLVFCDIESAHLWRQSLEAVGLAYVRTGAWVKPNSTPQFTGDRPAVGFEAVVIAHPPGRKHWNGGGARAVWQHPIELNRSGKGTDRLHTTQKPLSLLLELVALFSNPGELVCDPFAGSGTTGVASLRLGRRFWGAERDAAHATTARERLDAETACSTLESARAGQLPMFGERSR